jgi:hypothetical protein
MPYPLPLPDPLAEPLPQPLPEPLLLPWPLPELPPWPLPESLLGLRYIILQSIFLLVAVKILQLLPQGIIRDAVHGQALLGLKIADSLLSGCIEIFIHRTFVKSKIGQSRFEAANLGNGVEMAQLQ